MDSLLAKIAEYGPGFAFGAIGFALHYMERKRSAELVDRLHKLSVASLEANQEHTKMYDSINRALSVLVDVIKHESR